MKTLVIGANGQVGHALLRALQPLGDVVATTRGGGDCDGVACEALDLAQPGVASALIARIKPDVVINAAAYTAVDKAESEAALATRINGEAPGEIATACADAGIPLVHYSTDYVFDGQGTHPYRPEDATAPLGVYGTSKLSGEESIRAARGDHVILRTAWVYGLHGHNFLRTMLRLGAERDQLNVVADQVGSPTPAWLIADVTAAVLRQGIRGARTHHVVTSGQTSWHGFAEAIFDEATRRGLLSRKPVLNAIPTSAYPTPARRPAYSVLDTGSLRDAFGIDLPEWRDALRQTLDRT